MIWKNSIGKKLGLAFTFIILLFSVKTFYTIYSLQKLFTFTEIIYEHPLPVSNSVLKVKVNSLKMYILMRDIVRAKDKPERNKYLQLIDEYEADAFQNLKIISERFLGDKNKVKEVNQLLLEWKKGRNEIIAYLEKGDIQRGYLIVREDEVKYLEKINKYLDEILNFAENKALTLYNEADEKEKTTIRAAYLILLFIILFSIFIGFLIIKAITSPIKYLTDTAQKISAGNLDIPLSITSSDEIGQLSNSFSNMTETLKSMIQTEKERVNELIEKDNRFKRLVDSIPGAIYIYSNKHGAIYYSKYVEIIFGYSITELQENPFLWQQSILDEYRDEIIKLSNSLRQNQKFEIEYQIKTKSGELKWILDRSTYIQIQEDEIIIEGLAMDITERKLTEQTLRKNEEQFRSLAENSIDYIMRYDSQFRHIYANNACLKVSGKTWDEFIGKTHKDMGYSPELSELWETKIQKVFETGEPQNEIFEWEGANGTIVLDWRVMPEFEYGTNKVISALGVSRDISELKKSEKALRESESRARAMLNAIPDMVFRLNKEGIYLDYKADSKDLYAQSSKVIGVRNRDITPPEFADLIEEKTKLAIDTGELITFEFQLNMPDGLHDYESRMIASGKDEVTAIVRDITIRKQIENALKESELRFRHLAETAPVGIYRTDENGNCIYVNERWCSITGLQEQEAMGVGWVKALHPDDKEKVFQNWESFVKGEEAFNVEYRFIHTDNSFIWVTGLATRETDLNGKVTGYIGTITDISNLKKIEESLWESKERLEVAASAGIIGIWDLDIINNYQYWDSVMYKLYGLTKEEWGGDYESWAKTIYPEDLKYVEEEVQAAMRGEREYEPEFRIVWPDGSIRYIKAASKTIFNDQKKPIRMIGINYDLTEQKKIQQEIVEALKKAEAANKAKTEFLATMSHEIRTPMNAILGFTDLLEKNITDNKHISYIKAIQSGGKTLLRLINDILDLAKIESGKIILQYETVNLNKFIEDIGNIFQQKIREKKLQLIIDIEKSLPVFFVMDDLRLRQILFNLLGNAIKFTEKGYIKLTVNAVSHSYDGNYLGLSIAVEDTGIGIPKEECNKIFNSFYKFEPTGLRKYEGTGLGLSISRRLCEAMGGKLSVKSEEGKGSIFTLVLPKVEITTSEEIIKHNEYEPIPDISGYAGTILIVDDIHSNRELIKESFIDTEIIVIEAHNGLDAIEIAKQNRPDLILMDLKMPVMDGFEACNIIKHTDELKSIPVVAITASSLETREKLHLFDGYLRKPVSLVVLYNEIIQHLKITKNTGHLSTDSKVLSGENIENLDQLLSILTENFLPQLDAFSKRQPLKDLKKFSSSIIKLGEEYKSNILISYGKTILGGAEEFDMEKIRRTLWSLPDIIKKMEHLRKEER